MPRPGGSTSAIPLPINPVSIRLVALIALLGAQLLAVSLSFDAYSPGLEDSGRWFAFLSYSGHFAKVAVAVLVFTLMGLIPRMAHHLQALSEATSGYRYYYPLLGQLLGFALLLWLTALIFDHEGSMAELSSALVLAWITMIAATGGLWLASVAPAGFWRGLLRRESKLIAAALLVGLLAWLLASFSQALWLPLSEATFYLSASLLGQIYPDIVINTELKWLGAQHFVVSIAPQCSGYEGIGLMTIFTAFYLAVFRREFRFPQALLLFPIGITAIWLFNVLRIVLLISIGASFSPAVALGGFHSQAGWISFILVTVAMLMLAYRMRFFSKAPAADLASARGLSLPMALLIPFIALLASTMVSSALSADFDWLYPLRVIAVAAALAFCWRIYALSKLTFDLNPWLIGFVVFCLWILIVPADAARNASIAAQLSAESQLMVVAWLVFRCLGSVITVPIAEELLFRGYLLSRLAGMPIALEGRVAFSWIGLLASSLLFGLLHADWLAGMLAGVIFGLVRYRGASIKDAIVAHASTNLFLSIYVLGTGNWSLW